MRRYVFLIPILTIGILFTYYAIKLSNIDVNQAPPLPKKWLSKALIHLNGSQKKLQTLESDAQIVLLKNNDSLLPLQNLTVSTTYLTLGGNGNPFLQSIELFDTGETQTMVLEYDEDLLKKITSQRIVVSIHAQHPDSLNLSRKAILALDKLPASTEKILIIFGSWTEQNTSIFSSFDAVVYAPENHPIIQDRCAQKIMGALPFSGNLIQDFGSFEKGYGIHTESNGRLNFCDPEILGLSKSSFNRIDQIALQGITEGAYPGCQIAIAVKGSIIYRKSYGKATYEKEAKEISNDDVYDIASITKIASSTLMAMQLNYQGKLKLDETLGAYIPEITGKSEYSDIIIREMMAHQSGLEPFIPFYKKTLTDGNPSKKYYAKTKNEDFTIQVADSLFLNKYYPDSMYAQILRNPLKEKKYVYSDLCYYFMQKIFDKITNEKQDTYVRNHIYNLMGLRNINYTPLKYFPKTQIIPTEKDGYFRNQLLWGYVHDPGAAMLGGVGGHAGVFSNATDLASIMQLFLNNGQYAGQRFFDQKTREEFTKAQFPGNKRGIGFDRPGINGGGTCDESASQQSFGHSGFTGALAWADPVDDIVFIFLSNRVHPSQDNWKLRDMGIRTKMQHEVYQIVHSK